jgi:hypothetical protein
MTRFLEEVLWVARVVAAAVAIMFAAATFTGLYNDGFRRGYEQCEIDSDIGAWDSAPNTSL